MNVLVQMEQFVFWYHKRSKSWIDINSDECVTDVCSINIYDRVRKCAWLHSYYEKFDLYVSNNFAFDWFGRECLVKTENVFLFFRMTHCFKDFVRWVSVKNIVIKRKISRGHACIEHNWSEKGKVQNQECKP